MDKKFIIKPLEGIEWNGHFVPLKCSRETVEKVFGKPDAIENRYYYFDSELRFDFDDNNEVEFIEFLGGTEGELSPEIYGVDAFLTHADELYDILSGQNRGEIDDSEKGYSYAFVEISIGVYRATTPEDVAEMIEEAQKENEPLSKEECNYEIEKASHWETIGLGVEGYYRD